ISHNEYLLDGRPRRLSRSYIPQHTFSSITTQPKTSSFNNSYNSSPRQSATHRYVDNNFNDLSPSNISQKGKNCVLPSTDPKDNADLLTLILGKLQELDTIKNHLAKLDSQMLSFANLNGLLAQWL
ncbi:9610_t:CDS:1, partial [Funneliformis geosporum]